MERKTRILLETASAIMSNPNTGECSWRIRIILDLASRKSDITNKLRKYLNLVTVSTENLIVKTFGSTTETAQACVVVQACIRGVNNDL